MKKITDSFKSLNKKSKALLLISVLLLFFISLILFCYIFEFPQWYSNPIFKPLEYLKILFENHEKQFIISVVFFVSSIIFLVISILNNYYNKLKSLVFLSIIINPAIYYFVKIYIVGYIIFKAFSS